MHTVYYVDESGHSGDLAKYDPVTGFGDQPYFSLAAIGVRDVTAFESEIVHLRRKHGVKMPELKASKLWDRPGFFLDLFQIIRERRMPYFIEIVDKKFFLCMHIMTFQLLRPFPGSPEGAETNYVRNELAEFLHRNAPDTVFAAFIGACIAPSDSTLRAELQTILEWVKIAPDEGGRGQALQHSVILALEAYETERAGNNSAFLDFLPPPDLSKSGKRIWMLPNLASLMNIYARINLYQEEDLSEASLVHDEQAHFDEILTTAKSAAESLSGLAETVYTPHASFRFIESASLSFLRSHDLVGAQCADVLAGFCMRYARAASTHATETAVEIHEGFRHLLAGSEPTRGIGVNHVMTTRSWLELANSAATGDWV
jgi:Protein of unknown function (DUF3800)